MNPIRLSDDGELHVSQAQSPTAVLLLGHGAGGSIEALDLVALATGLPPRGVTVVRHVQPWKAHGKKMTARPAVLDEGWRTAVYAVVERFAGVPLFVGGHSAGARCAARGTAAPDMPACAGLVTLSFPLHPPGHPEKSRVAELRGVPVPVVAVQGERDTFGGAEELAAAVPAGWFAQPMRRLVEIPGAGHDLKPPAKVMKPAEAMALLVEAVGEFIAAESVRSEAAAE